LYDVPGLLHFREEIQFKQGIRKGIPCSNCDTEKMP
jgi:hypothetical protein